MKILITLLLALFISGQAIPDFLDSLKILDKGFTIHKTERSDKYGNYLDFYVIYEKKLFVCSVSTNVEVKNDGAILCKQQDSFPARDINDEIIPR